MISQIPDSFGQVNDRITNLMKTIYDSTQQKVLIFMDLTLENTVVA